MNAELERAIKVIGNTRLHTYDGIGNIQSKPISESHEFKVIAKALTELEFYKSFPQIQEASLIPEVNLKLVTCELNLREIKRDVKKFMELDNMGNEEFNGYDYDVWRALKDKLMKVGNEE